MDSGWEKKYVLPLLVNPHKGWCIDSLHFSFCIAFFSLLFLLEYLMLGAILPPLFPRPTHTLV